MIFVIYLGASLAAAPAGAGVGLRAVASRNPPQFCAFPGELPQCTSPSHGRSGH